jgi:ABC-type glutathione transport system ATPase component
MHRRNSSWSLPVTAAGRYAVGARYLVLLLDLRDEFGLTRISISHNLHIVWRLAARIVEGALA